MAGSSQARDLRITGRYQSTTPMQADDDLCVVNAAAGHEHVPNTNADEIKRRIKLPPLRLVEQRAHPELADLALAQQGDGKSDRPTSIDYVVNEQHAPPYNVGQDVAEKTHVTAACTGECRSC